MTSPIREIDPNVVLREMLGDRAKNLRAKDEVVSYYRRPYKLTDGRKAAMPGWITWGDTQAGKRDDYVYRGFTPLFKYGRLWDGGDRDGELFKQYGPWGPILSKPGGPEELPVEQIVTYRWYRPENIGSPAQGYFPMSHVRFPQLAEAVSGGLKIQEFLCPECESVTFLQAVFLARHLRNSHNWDRADILAWGASMDIDFSREFRPRVIQIPTIEPVEVTPPTPETTVVVETVVTPGKPVVTSKVCTFCAMAKAGVCKKHRAKVPA